MTPLLIRADADSQVGTGHIMRCLALAQAWAQRGCSVTFLSSANLPLALKDRLESEGFGVHSLTIPSGTHADADQLLSLAQELDAENVVIDGYLFGSDYQRQIKNAGLRLLLLDDYGHADHYTADLILNQNIGAHELLYQYREPYTQLLLGTRYTLLRQEFLTWRGLLREAPTQASRILITLGGSDPDNVTARVLHALDQLPPPLEVVAVIGAANRHRAGLEAIAASSRHNLSLEYNVQDMPALMAWADLAISASGSTAWELAFMGVPAILIVLAENQRPIAQGMVQQNAALALEAPPQVSELAAQITSLAHDREQRVGFSRAGQALVDGYGAARVVNVLSVHPPALHMRPVSNADVLLVWHWANDALVRANSFHSLPIPWETHLAWYTARLQSSTVRFWMLESGGVPVAHIRYERLDDDTAEINYTVAPDERGKGYGTRLLADSWARACRELGVNRVQGITFETNIASMRAFEKAGFILSERRLIEGHACAVFSRECSHVD